MSKIIAFLGSPGENGYSTKLVEEAIKGAKSKGAEVKIYNLNDDGIRGCQGCLYCRSHEGCSTKDYLQPMYEDLKDSDGIIFGSPIYGGRITGQAKQLLDRLFPVIDETFQPRYPGIKVFTILVQGNVHEGMLENCNQHVNSVFSDYGWKSVDSLILDNTASSGFKLSDKLLKQAFTTGKLLTK